MKLRSLLALALALACAPAYAQVNPGTSPLSIAKGGTAAASASAARTSLGLAIGTNVEAWNPTLDCFAALATVGIVQRTGVGACAALSQAQLTALINPATATLSGALPAWPNNTTSFFRGDGTYQTLNFAALGGQAAFAQLPNIGADSVLGNPSTSGSAALAGIPLNNCAGALSYSTATHTFGCNSTSGTGTVNTAGNGLILSGTGGTTLGITAPVSTVNGGTGADNSTNAANDVVASNGANGSFVHTALLTLINTVCTALPTPCAALFGYRSVAWYGAVCDGSTNDQAALQAAIAATPTGGSTIRIPGPCVFATPLSFIGKAAIRVVGSSTDTTLGASIQPSGLIYSGGAATRAIDLRDTGSVSFDGIAFGWTNTAFAGIFLDYGSQTPGTQVSSHGAVRHSNFAPLVSPTGNVTCVNVSEAIEATIEFNEFQRCFIGIHGQNLIAQSTVILINHNEFYLTGSNAIAECGEAWKITSNTFEASAAGVLIGFGNSSSLPCHGIEFDSNWFGDATVSGGTAISITATGASITGGRITGTTSSAGIGITGGGGYSIRGVEFDTLANGINFSSSPVGVNVNGNSFTGVNFETNGTCTNCSLGFNSP